MRTQTQKMAFTNIKSMERAKKVMRIRTELTSQDYLGKRVQGIIDNCLEIDVANAVNQLKRQKTEPEPAHVADAGHARLQQLQYAQRLAAFQAQQRENAEKKAVENRAILMKQAALKIVQEKAQ